MRLSENSKCTAIARDQVGRGALAHGIATIHDLAGGILQHENRFT